MTSIEMGIPVSHSTSLHCMAIFKGVLDHVNVVFSAFFEICQHY